MDEKNLAALEHDYQSLQDQVRELGFVAPGSVIERYTVCAAPTCRCHADPLPRTGRTSSTPASSPARPSPDDSTVSGPSATANGSRTDADSTSSSARWTRSHAARLTSCLPDPSGTHDRADLNPESVGAHIAIGKCGTCGLERLARALKNWSASRRGGRKGARVGFPRFRSKHKTRPSIRFTTGAIRENWSS